MFKRLLPALSLNQANMLKSNLFIQLHWLPIPQRINYKLAILTYKALHGLAPPYLCNLVNWYAPSRYLRSNAKFLAKQKSTKELKSNGNVSKVMYMDRAFENLGPRVFNSLPLDVSSCKTLTTFRSKLKTHLFEIASGLADC